MKDTSLTEMPINELNDLLISEKDRLNKLRMSHAVSPLENPLSIKYSRKKVINKFSTDYIYSEFKAIYESII